MFDSIDAHGDIIRRGAFAKQWARSRSCECPRAMIHVTSSVMSSGHATRMRVLPSPGNLTSTPSSASRPTETPRAAECQEENNAGQCDVALEYAIESTIDSRMSRLLGHFIEKTSGAERPRTHDAQCPRTDDNQ